VEEPIIPQTETSEKKKDYKKIFALILILSVILNVILIIKIGNHGSEITGAAILTNPSTREVLDNNVQNDKVILHYRGLRKSIEDKMSNYSAVNNVGVFVQDIKTGSWMGINERKGFSPASLAKIPIMMAILKKIDRKEINMEDIITIQNEDIEQSYIGINEIKEGDKFTIKELLANMVTHSDNTAKNALMKHLSMYELNEVFEHVGIPNPYLTPDKSQTMSPRDYTRFFKTLYYSTFFSPEISEFALNLTINTEVENLLPEGVPSNIVVAHKFGIYSGISLHDCGIVYHKKNPYFICIMTNELDETKGATLIRSISKDTYEFVNRP